MSSVASPVKTAAKVKAVPRTSMVRAVWIQALRRFLSMRHRSIGIHATMRSPSGKWTMMGCMPSRGGIGGNENMVWLRFYQSCV